MEKTLTVLNQEQLVEKQTQLYCNKLVLAMKQWHQDNGMPAEWETKYIYETGRKYLKVSESKMNTKATMNTDALKLLSTDKLATSLNQQVGESQQKVLDTTY